MKHPVIVRSTLYGFSILLLIATYATVSYSLFGIPEVVRSAPIIDGFLWYVNMIAVFGSIYLIPQILFTVCLGLLTLLFVRARNSGALCRRDTVIISLINSVSVCLLVVFTARLFGAGLLS